MELAPFTVPAPSKTLSVVILTRGRLELVKRAIRSLLLSRPEEVEVQTVIVEHGGELSRALAEEQEFTDAHIKWVSAPDDASCSEMTNIGVASMDRSDDHILLLDNDVSLRAGAINAMLACLALPDVGIVGAKLLHADGTIQHVGVVFGTDGRPSHTGWGKDPEHFGPASRNDYYDAVTRACMLIRRETWTAVGGFDPAYFWNYEDTDFCLMAKEKGWKSYVTTNAVALHDEGASSDHRKTGKHSVERNWSVFAAKWIETKKIREVLGLPLDKHTFATQTKARYNIAFVPWSKNSGVVWWRIETPAKMILRKKLMNGVLLYGDMPTEHMVNVMCNSDVTVMHGIIDEWLGGVAADRDGRPFQIVYDYDDHPLYISPYAQAYASFGCNEVSMTDTATGEQVWLWRDGQNGLDIDRNRIRRQRQLSIISGVDCVTTTTPTLAEYMATLNPRVEILPNCIDFDIYRHKYSLWERQPGPVRIGWHGGDNHWHDVSQIGPALTKYVNEHDVQLVLFGAFYKGPFRGIDESKVINEEWVNVEAFPHKLAALAIDVAVIPLADPEAPAMKFNHYKSGIKYLEYSALRIPSLVTANRAAYDMCKDGVNALTFHDDVEFTEKLDRYVKDAALRKQIGAGALDYVREHHDLGRHIYAWCELYSDLAEKSVERRALAPPAEEDKAEAKSSAVVEGSEADNVVSFKSHSG
jgi:GT2 family glycosyltransferase